MIAVVPVTKHAWKLVSVDAALKIVTVAEAEPVRMASVSVGKGLGLAAVAEMGDQLFISILSRNAVLLLEKSYGIGEKSNFFKASLICWSIYVCIQILIS